MAVSFFQDDLKKHQSNHKMLKASECDISSLIEIPFWTIWKQIFHLVALKKKNVS